MTVLDEIAAEMAKHPGKGYDATHDDGHANSEIAKAAANLANPFVAVPGAPRWSDELWHRHTPRQRLIIAASLIVREVERLDRLAARL